RVPLHRRAHERARGARPQLPKEPALGTRGERIRTRVWSGLERQPGEGSSAEHHRTFHEIARRSERAVSIERPLQIAHAQLQPPQPDRALAQEHIAAEVLRAGWALPLLP